MVVVEGAGTLVRIKTHSQEMLGSFDTSHIRVPQEPSHELEPVKQALPMGKPPHPTKTRGFSLITPTQREYQAGQQWCYSSFTEESPLRHRWDQQIIGIELDSHGVPSTSGLEPNLTSKYTQNMISNLGSNSEGWVFDVPSLFVYNTH